MTGEANTKDSLYLRPIIKSIHTENEQKGSLAEDNFKSENKLVNCCQQDRISKRAVQC